LSAQGISEKELNNTEWYVNNENENFYNSDTISLIRIEKYNTYQDEINSYLIMQDYNNQKDYSVIKLNEKGEADIVNKYVESWTESRFNDKWTWKFDKKEKEISFYLKKQLYSKFEIYSINNDSVISEYGYSGDGTKSKLNLIILEMKKVK
jgi:hypothetical protein